MFFEYHSFSELIHDFSFSWEFISAVGFVLLIWIALGFYRLPYPGSVGSDCVACSRSFLVPV